VIRPGEVYVADFDQAGPHPVIVVSREDLNRGRYVVAVVCTSARLAVRRTLPNCVPFRAGQFGLTVDCVAQCDNILSVEKARLDLANGPLGMLDEMALRDVIRAIGHVIESDCEPLQGGPRGAWGCRRQPRSSGAGVACDRVALTKLFFRGSVGGNTDKPVCQCHPVCA
jgi:mRNA-degrading endonuclease toxin of MazEF toxin-antitoxin module